MPVIGDQTDPPARDLPSHPLVTGKKQHAFRGHWQGIKRLMRVMRVMRVMRLKRINRVAYLKAPNANGRIQVKPRHRHAIAAFDGIHDREPLRRQPPFTTVDRLPRQAAIAIMGCRDLLDRVVAYLNPKWPCPPGNAEATPHLVGAEPLGLGGLCLLWPICTYGLTTEIANAFRAR